ncbi:cellulose biosynthesis protein BcsD [Nguyenibacter vanlangensis]|uniref:Cellulose biosynthesis protein BcsD n=1 Tax=Nguyenibacter vanlangensis TaxID=1216886 RepID=A0ABZ3D7B4_9PROT
MSSDMIFFLREFAAGFDAQVGSEARDRFLRQVGASMAGRLTLPPCETVEALELEINAHLALLGWGRATLAVDTARKKLRIRHAGLPRIGSAGAPAGYWLASCLAGLYETWIGRQPDAQPGYGIIWQPDQETADDLLTLEFGAGDHGARRA